MQTTSFFKITFTAVMAVFFSLGIVSCSDDDIKEGPFLYLPEKIEIDDEGDILTHNFLYDNDLRLKEVNSVHSDGDNERYTIDYDSEGRISKVTYKFGIRIDTYTYTYSGSEMTVLANENGSESTAMYNVDSQGLVGYCRIISEEKQTEIYYQYDGGGRLLGKKRVVSGQNDMPILEITYNTYSGMATDINVTTPMAVTLWDINDDLFTFLLTKNGMSIATIKDMVYNEVSTYSYNTEGSVYPSTYSIVKTTSEGDFPEYSATVTYKKIQQ